ncbi:class I SAM-dependent methyltransferase [candidate division KSB1 bacterium]|nr:class I SAM-dependent methyltransferase [candidate division KSB1 bacterium]
MDHFRDRKIRNCPYCRRSSCKLRYVIDGFRIVKCKTCGFVYVQNPFRADSKPQNYNTYFENADVIEERTQNMDAEQQSSWNIYHCRIGLLERIVPEGRLLEIGCGRGYFLHLAKERGYDVTGIDISSVAAEYAKRKYNIHVLTGDMERIGPLNTSFDIITLWHVLEHFNDPAAVLEKVNKLLNTDGYLILEVPNLNSLKFQLAGGKNRWAGGNHPRYHLSFFTIGTLRKMLKKSGFTGIRVIHMNYTDKQRPLLAGIKRVLDFIHVDSFLTIKAVKQKGFTV